MTSFIPLTMREFQALGRRPSLYGLRMAVAALGAAALLLAAWQSAGQVRAIMDWRYELTYRSEMLESLARTFAGMIALFQLAVVFFLTPLAASNLIAQERLDGTLQLLSLADIRGGDVWTAKFVAAFVQCELLLVSTLPIAAFASFFGGISVQGIAAQVGFLSCVTAFLCSVSLLLSARAATPNQALIASLSTSALLLCLILPELLFMLMRGLTLDQDRMSYYWRNLWDVLADATVYGADNFRAGASSPTALRLMLQHNVLAIGAALLVLCLAVALIGVRAIRAVPANQPVSTRRKRRHKRGRTRFPTAHLIVAGSLPPATAGPMLRIAAGLMLLGVSLFPYGAGWLAILFVLCHMVSVAMASLQRNDAIDEIAATPIADVDLAQAIVGVNLSRAKLCIIPLILGSLLMARFVLQQTQLMRQLSWHGWYEGWLSFDAVTGLIAYVVAIIVAFSLLMLQAFSTVSITSALRAAGLSVGTATSMGVSLVCVVFLITTAIPVVLFVWAQTRTFEGTVAGEMAMYLSTTLTIIWNLLLVGGAGYVSLLALARFVRSGQALRRKGAVTAQ